MKIGVISDIHANLEALNVVLEKLKDIDIILCVGDIVGYGPNPNECIDLVKKRCKYVILGNHDHCVLHLKTASWFNPVAEKAIKWTEKVLDKDRKKYLESLESQLKIEIDGLKINMYHGSPDDPLYQYVYLNSLTKDKFEKWLISCDILILGHNHIPYTYKSDQGLAINPGAVGQPRDGNPYASYSIIDTKKRDAKNYRVKYKIDKIANEIKEKNLPNFLAMRLYQGI